MLKKLFIICVTLLISISAQAAAPIAQIQSMLAKPDILCGRFNQIKQLTGINKALHSNGRFCVVTGKGILWHTLQPFPNTLRLTRDEIIQMQGDRTAMRLDVTQEPAVRMINSVLFSLLAGDFSQLDKLFAMNGHAENNYWQVTLQARDAALAKAIGYINLQGDQYVRKVNMITPNGDKTYINFSAIKTGKKAISKEDEALFDQKQT